MEEKEMLENVEHCIKNFNGRMVDCIAVGNMYEKYVEQKSELEKYKTLVDKYGGVEQLEKYILEISKVLGDVSIDAIKTVIQDKDKILECLKSELEKYKNIAEKLAEQLEYMSVPGDDGKIFTISTTKDAIEWAKKEVENG